MSSPAFVSSPCVGLCRLDLSGAACLGCGRTPVEIRAWLAADEEDRRTILDRVAARRACA